MRTKAGMEPQPVHLQPAATQEQEVTHLAVEVGERTDDLADADEEDGGEGGREQEAVQRRDQVILDLQTQLIRIQEGIPEVVSGAEHQDVGPAHRAVLQHGATLVSPVQGLSGKSTSIQFNFICTKSSLH